MKKYLEILRNCKLFESIEDENLLVMLSCLGAEVMSYTKNQYIFTEGETASHMGILLSGTAQIVRVDFYGNRSIVTTIKPSELFGESFACAETESVPVNVIAEIECEVMLIDSRKILHPCCNTCEFHSRIIFNLMKSIAAKNLLLNQHGSNFTIPYDRQELADFLEVDRSGLSAEISKLRKENVIECKRSFFRFL